MQRIDINQTPDAKINSIIKKQYGGRYSFSEILKFKGVGLANLKYLAGNSLLDKHHSESQRLKVTMELHKAGLGVYCRNMDSNFLLLFQYDEIQKLELTKAGDIIQPKKRSFYNTLKSFGFPHHKLTGMLHEKEIIELNSPLLKLYFGDNEVLFIEGQTSKIKKYQKFIEKLVQIEKHYHLETDVIMGADQ